MKKRIVSLLLVLVLLGNSIPCAFAAAPSTEEEIAQAVAAGLVPEGWESQLDTPMSLNDFCALMIRVIARYDESAIPAWEALAADALTRTRGMKREDAIIAVYEAACLLGQGQRTNGDWAATDQRQDGGAHFWELSNEYPEWSNLNDPSPFETKGDNMIAGAYHFAQGQTSRASGKRVFDFDKANGDLHMLDPLTKEEALLILLRFGDSLTERTAPKQPEPTATQPAQTEATHSASAEDTQAQEQLCREILAKADARREAILSSPTTITVTGTSYFVSAEGDDGNDGLTEKTPWRTAAKVNAADLRPGDGVFFRRGDVWRGDMITSYREGITYSAYGAGAKPAFYGSPENGGGAEKWALLEGTENIWVYEKPMPYLGSIVMNEGEAIATQYLSYWNGTAYTAYGTDDMPLQITEIADMTYFSDIDLTDWQKDPDHHNVNSDVHVYDCLETGPLYLRCDAGNPGAVFSSIEFGAGWGLSVGGGSTVDNLCVKYVGNCGVISDPGNPLGMTVTNCEVGFMGDIYLSFEQSDFHGVPGGEGFGFNGCGSVCRNNYVHDGRDGGFTIELGWDATVQAGQQRLGDMTAVGNLFERNNGGIGIVNFLEKDEPIEIANIRIDDNYFLYIGYRNVLFEGVEENVSCFHVWFAGKWDDLTGVTLHNNTFFLAAPKLINLLNIGAAELDFEGNTYVQGKYQRAMTYARSYDAQQDIGAADAAAFLAAVRDLLGDATGEAHTLTLGLDHAETNRARALGLVPEDAPEDLSAQITQRDMTALLSAAVAAIAPDKLPAWETLSAPAAQSNGEMHRGDGMIALLEAAMTLGMDVTASDLAWRNFERMNAAQGDAWREIDNANWDIYPNTQVAGIDPGNPGLCLYHLALLFACGHVYPATYSYLLDFDEANGTLHGTEPLTWEAAINAIVRLYDSLDADTDKLYLARPEA